MKVDRKPFLDLFKSKKPTLIFVGCSHLRGPDKDIEDAYKAAYKERKNENKQVNEGREKEEKNIKKNEYAIEHDLKMGEDVTPTPKEYKKLNPKMRTAGDDIF